MAVRRPVGEGAIALVAIAGFGCVLGLLFTGPLSDATLAHLDEPTRVFFHAHRTVQGRRLISVISRAGATDVVAVVATLAGILLRLVTKSWRQVVVVLAAFVGAVTITAVDKAVVARDLPRLRGDPPISRSGFPSGHATLAIAVYGALAVVVREVTDGRSARAVAGAVSTVVIALVAFSRVYLGLHWLTEVVGGLVLGGAWLGAVVLESSRPAPAEPY